MESRDDKIIETAIALFSRYGIRKTTMGDLAQAAGLSRQTLYNAFSNKEDVMRGAISYTARKGTSALAKACDTHSDLATQLDAFFEIAPIAWFDMIQSAPDAAELIDGINAAGNAEMVEASRHWAFAITEMLKPYATTLSKHDQTPEDLAQFIYATSSTAKQNAIDRAQLLKRLATLKAAVLALTS